MIDKLATWWWSVVRWRQQVPTPSPWRYRSTDGSVSSRVLTSADIADDDARPRKEDYYQRRQRERAYFIPPKDWR